MIVHQLIDALALDVSDQKDGMAIAVAHKFEIKGQDFLSKEVLEYADLLICCGNLRLPFNVCYFEVVATTGDTISLLAVDDGFGKVLVKSYIYRRDLGEWHARHDPSGWNYNEDHEFGYLKAMDGTSVAARATAAAIAFMDLKETRRETVTVKPRVNAHRIAQGKQPFHDHTILTINKAARDALRTKGDALIARRAHWRRGHLRHLPDKIVPVAPCIVRGEGFVTKDYRI